MQWTENVERLFRWLHRTTIAYLLVTDIVGMGQPAGKETQSMDVEESPRVIALRLYTRRDHHSYFVSAAAIGDVHGVHNATIRIDLVEGNSGAIGGQGGSDAVPVTSRTIERLLPGTSNEVIFPLSQIPHGSWYFRARVIDGFGRECPTEFVQIDKNDRPEWFGSDAGVARGVPSPWTPLTLDDTTVHCWGRSYEIGDSSILRQISTMDVPLLAAPIRLLIDGQSATFSSTQWLEKSDDQIVLVRTAMVPNSELSIRMQIQIEFDGMVRVDWSVTAARPTPIRSMVLEIPYRSEQAKLFYQWRGKYHSGDDQWIGQMPREGMWKGFRPFIWIGDERCGLSWFAESNANWHNADPSRAIEVAREENATVLRLHIISEPVVLMPQSIVATTTDRRPLQTGTLRYAMGFQATPVKPLSPDAWDYRAFCLQQHTPGTDEELKLPTPLLDQLERAGVRTVIIFEHWTDIEGHYLTTHQRELKQIVEACHARGMQVLLYFGFLVSSLAPEYELLAEESVVLPKTGWSVYFYPPQPVQTAWRVCLNSAWQDFVPYGVARVMEELDVDGVYLDGTSHAFACRNLSHGCGILRPDGSVAPTFPIFAVRSAMKRIYHAVRSRKRNGQVNVHNSADMVIPSLAFATSTWDGEQFVGLKAGTDADTFLPLDMFRTEFMGRPWGVPAELLCYRGKPLTYRQAWALAILHDVPVRPMATPDGQDLELCASIWRAMDKFDRSGATWAGYWENNPSVGIDGKKVFASVYSHPANGRLIAVANLGTDVARTTIRVDGQQAIDALTERPMPFKNATIKIELDPLDFTLIRIPTDVHNNP